LTELNTSFSLNQMANAKKPKRKAALLGVGLDSDGLARGGRQAYAAAS